MTPGNYSPGEKTASQHIADAISSLHCARLELVADQHLGPASAAWCAEIYVREMLAELPDSACKKQEPPHAE